MLPSRSKSAFYSVLISVLLFLVGEVSTAGYNQGYNQPPPGPPPGYNQPPLGFNQPPAGYNQPPPGFNQPPPGFNQPPPGFNQPPPGFNQSGPPPQNQDPSAIGILGSALKGAMKDEVKNRVFGFAESPPPPPPGTAPNPQFNNNGAPFDPNLQTATQQQITQQVPVYQSTPDNNHNMPDNNNYGPQKCQFDENKLKQLAEMMVNVLTPKQVNSYSNTSNNPMGQVGMTQPSFFPSSQSQSQSQTINPNVTLPPMSPSTVFGPRFGTIASPDECTAAEIHRVRHRNYPDFSLGLDF